MRRPELGEKHLDAGNYACSGLSCHTGGSGEDRAEECEAELAMRNVHVCVLGGM